MEIKISLRVCTTFFTVHHTNSFKYCFPPNNIQLSITHTLVLWFRFLNCASHRWRQQQLTLRLLQKWLPCIATRCPDSEPAALLSSRSVQRELSSAPDEPGAGWRGNPGHHYRCCPCFYVVNSSKVHCGFDPLLFFNRGWFPGAPGSLWPHSWQRTGCVRGWLRPIYWLFCKQTPCLDMWGRSQAERSAQ